MKEKVIDLIEIIENSDFSEFDREEAKKELVRICKDKIYELNSIEEFFEYNHYPNYRKNSGIIEYNYCRLERDDFVINFLYRDSWSNYTFEIEITGTELNNDYPEILFNKLKKKKILSLENQVENLKNFLKKINDDINKYKLIELKDIK